MTRKRLGSSAGAFDIAGIWGRNTPLLWAPPKGAALSCCLGSILENQGEEDCSLNNGDLTRTFSYFLIGNIHSQMTPSSSPRCHANLKNPHASLEKYMCQV